jgi:arsenite methyltransferase
MAISDVLSTSSMPAELKADATLLCGCIAGAASTEQITGWLSDAGFVQIQITSKPESREMIAGWAPGRGIEDYVVSAIVEARKPR